MRVSGDEIEIYETIYCATVVTEQFTEELFLSGSSHTSKPFRMVCARGHDSPRTEPDHVTITCKLSTDYVPEKDIDKYVSKESAQCKVSQIFTIFCEDTRGTKEVYHFPPLSNCIVPLQSPEI